MKKSEIKSKIIQVQKQKPVFESRWKWPRRDEKVFLGGMQRNVISDLLKGRKKHYNLGLAVMTERYQYVRNLASEEKITKLDMVCVFSP